MPAGTSRRRAVARGAPLTLAGVPATVAEAVGQRIAAWPHGVVRTHRLEGGHREQSYAELWRRAGAMAAGLRASGVRPGHTVVLLIEEAVDFAPAFWACLRGGFIAAPLTTAARDALHRRQGDGLREALGRLTCVTILADAAFATLATALRLDHGLPMVTLAEAEAAGPGDGVDGPPADPTCLIPTSGSTGRLKLVALRPEAVLARNFDGGDASFATSQRFLGTFALDSISTRLGLFLRYGSWTEVPASALTARPTVLLDAIEAHRIDVVSVTNSLIRQVMAAAEPSGRRWRLDSLCRLSLGGEAIVPAVMRRVATFLERHGASPDIIRAGYGTTETGSLVLGTNPLAQPADGEGLSLGAPAPGIVLRIAGPGDTMLVEGETGEVQVRCPEKIFSGYWNEPDATAESFAAGGWWRTGDVGRLEAGALSLHGRAKELLVVHGRKMSLAAIDAEIETVLPAGDRAFACAVLRPGEEGERLAVVVVAADDARYADVAESIRRVVSRRFGVRPDPVVAATWDEIPIAASGKLRRLELAARVQAGTIGRVAASTASAGRPPAAVADPDAALAQIWRDVLNLDGALDRDASFFELGGDSLRAVMLDAAIAEQLGARIPAEAFFASPTFATLSSLVAGGAQGPGAAPRVPEPSVPWPLPAGIRNTLLLHFETWDGHRPTRDRLIVGVNTSGRLPPLVWLFHDAVQFRQLARGLGPDQPLYALRGGGHVITHTEDEIQMLALRYVSEIAEALPDGPIFIGGACYGATIALAVAQHLLRRRRHVPLLTLMEWGEPLQPYPGPVLILYCRDSLIGNPYLRHGHPEIGWRRMFPTHTAVETSGNHANAFDDGYVDTWSRTLAAHMREAAHAPCALVPALAHRVTMRADDMPDHLPAGARRDIAVWVRNASPVAWPAWSVSGLALGNRWLTESGEIAERVDGRVPLPALAPGDEVRVVLPVTAPPTPGVMQLSVGVVEEGSTWFSRAQQAPLCVRVEIR